MPLKNVDESTYTEGSSIWFVCKFCRRAFQRRKYLLRHKRTFHPSRPTQSHDDCDRKITQNLRNPKKRKATREQRSEFGTMNDLLLPKKMKAGPPPMTSIERADNNKILLGASPKPDDDHGTPCQSDSDESDKFVKNSPKPGTMSNNFSIHPQKAQQVIKPTRNPGENFENSVGFPTICCNLCKKSYPRNESLIHHLRYAHRFSKLRIRDERRKWNNSVSSKETQQEQQGSVVMDLTETTPPQNMPVVTMTTTTKNRKRPPDTINKIKSRGSSSIKCRYCPERFDGCDDLRRHEMGHMGPNPFYCRYCGKVFKQKVCKIVHERVHTGEKPFECSYCSKFFTNKSGRNIHLKRHHTIMHKK